MLNNISVFIILKKKTYLNPAVWYTHLG